MSAVMLERPATGLPVAAAPRRTSPWLAVLPFAVVLAAADGFWVTSLREAVGAIQRTGHPMRNWALQSSLTLPLYVVAVLAAVAVAQRRRWNGARAVSAVVALGTVAGTVHLIGDSVFDYRLQDEHLTTMGSMGGLCLQTCLDHQWSMTWHLQVRAVLLGAVILLLTNLVAMFLVLAMRGGQFDLRRVDAGARPRPVVHTMVAGVLAAAAIHAAVIPEHRAEWWAAGLFFVVLTVAELANAAWLLRRPSTASLLATAAVAVVPLVAWTWSRATGLPFGPEAFEREAVGLPDLICSALELVVLVQAVWMLQDGSRRRATTSLTRLRLAVVAIVALGVVAAASPLGGFGTAGHHGEDEDAKPAPALVTDNAPADLGPLNGAGTLNKN